MQRVLLLDTDRNLKKELSPGFNPRRHEAYTWVDFFKPTPKELHILATTFGFHPLALADCHRPPSRPGLAQYEEYSFITLRCVSHHQHIKSSTTFLNVFLGPRYVITLHEEKLSFLDRLWSSYETDPSLFLKGTDYLLYSLLEALTSEFFPFFDGLEEKIEEIEEELFRRPGRNLLNQIFLFRRQVIKMRKFLGPQRDVADLLCHPDFPLVRMENRTFFLDIYNEYLRLVDHIDTLHELIGSALETYLSLTSNRLNEIMKVLTLVTTIMMPLSLIAGIYGMNFRYMPELEWRYGYPWALGLMVLVAGGMVGYFRKKGWF
ncbi:MAG: magnesium/cobalt transporter CorA [Thermanaeromonas sp.]|uniref:magnesium/cobalt transporter CorA n=1 Tax=Thermanaeromonas sp. TaxID=2003697 RepID=UPI00243F4450|nr:magnesium/cobalt transporter CorA [Thermanaeromonas sp.]MCG0277918.1 magnesium/cobalt transporter CorA [Thermanaeromonas sp.]